MIHGSIIENKSIFYEPIAKVSLESDECEEVWFRRWQNL